MNRCTLAIVLFCGACGGQAFTMGPTLDDAPAAALLEGGAPDVLELLEADPPELEAAADARATGTDAPAAVDGHELEAAAVDADAGALEASPAVDAPAVDAPPPLCCSCPLPVSCALASCGPSVGDSCHGVTALGTCTATVRVCGS